MRFSPFSPMHRAIRKLRWPSVVNYLANSDDPELKSIGEYIKADNYNYLTFPYEWYKEYNDISIDGGIDEDGYPYVIDMGKRLYGKKDQPLEKLKEYLRMLMAEQDLRSPHCYLPTDDSYPAQGSVIADVGAAEGIFTLRVIERIEKAYLFECQDSWVIPLQKTFAPWPGRIEIVNKYVADHTGGEYVTIDDFFAEKKIDVIKADIEGMEIDMCRGAQKTLPRISNLYLCAYHRQDDEKLLRKALAPFGFNITCSNGYILYHDDIENFSKPYVRRGVLHAFK